MQRLLQKSIVSPIQVSFDQLDLGSVVYPKYITQKDH